MKGAQLHTYPDDLAGNERETNGKNLSESARTSPAGDQSTPEEEHSRASVA